MLRNHNRRLLLLAAQNPTTTPIVRRKQLVETGLLLIGGSLMLGLHTAKIGWFQAALGGTLLTLLAPWLLFPVALIWFWIGHLMSKLTTKLLLTVLFVCLVVPLAWVRKQLGWDPLRQKQYKKNTSSVFIHRAHTFQDDDLRYPF